MIEILIVESVHKMCLNQNIYSKWHCKLALWNWYWTNEICLEYVASLQILYGFFVLIYQGTWFMNWDKEGVFNDGDDKVQFFMPQKVINENVTASYVAKYGLYSNGTDDLLFQ